MEGTSYQVSWNVFPPTRQPVCSHRVATVELKRNVNTGQSSTLTSNVFSPPKRQRVCSHRVGTIELTVTSIPGTHRKLVELDFLE
jgi:hypothetical protein